MMKKMNSIILLSMTAKARLEKMINKAIKRVESKLRVYKILIRNIS